MIHDIRLKNNKGGYLLVNPPKWLLVAIRKAVKKQDKKKGSK